MPDETRKEGRASHGFATLAGVLIAFLLLAAGYVHRKRLNKESFMIEKGEEPRSSAVKMKIRAKK